MADIKLFQAEDGGDIEFINGTPTLDVNGLETAVYLSLFGGNEDDGGLTADIPKQWWGNFSEPLEIRHYRSEAQHLMRSLAVVPANVRRVEDAALRDLSWMTTELGASTAARASIPALNTFKLQVIVEIDNQKIPFTFQVSQQ